MNALSARDLLPGQAMPLAFAALLGRVRAKSRAAREPALVILPPSDLTGSLGDEAMAMALIAGCRDPIHRTAFLSLRKGHRWFPSERAIENLEAHGWYEHRATWHILALLWRLRRFSHFALLGADVLDGFYGSNRPLKTVRLARLVARMGLRSAILGFSWNEVAVSTLTQALGKLPPEVELCVRDPVSHRRLQRAINRPVTLGADLAFLLEATESPGGIREHLAWIQSRKGEGRLVIGVNLNAIPFEPATEPAIANLAAALATLLPARPELSLVLIPHDYRGPKDDLMWLRLLLDHLPVVLRSRVHLVDQRMDCREAKLLCGLLDGLFTGRMHLGIAAVSQGVPALCVDYQGKVEGLCEHLQSPELRIQPVAVLNPGALGAALDRFLTHLGSHAATIRQRLPALRALAGKNIAAVLGREHVSDVRGISGLRTGPGLR